MATSNSAPPDDLLAPAAIADPQAFFRRLREADPVYWSERHRAFILTGHAEVHAGFRDRRLSSAAAMNRFRAKLSARHQALISDALTLLDGWMLLNDPPDHERLRDPVRRAFTPAVAAALAPRILAHVDSLLDDADAVIDIVSAFSQPLTAMVIGDLLGIAPQERAFLADWTRDFGKLIYGASSREADYAEVVGGAGTRFHAALGPLIDARRAAPQDDLLSHLVVNAEQNGWRTSELLGAASMLLFAGHDTTSALLASSVRALCLDPAARARFSNEPALVESAVEELLRYDGPSKTFVRTANEDLELGGHRIAAGQTLWLSILGANHDPAVFDAPDSLRLDRDPNPHLAFGGGIHFCLGSALARTEARIALSRLFERRPHLTLCDHAPAWSPTLVDRSLLALPVRLDG